MWGSVRLPLSKSGIQETKSKREIVTSFVSKAKILDGKCYMAKFTIYIPFLMAMLNHLPNPGYPKLMVVLL